MTETNKSVAWSKLVVFFTKRQQIQLAIRVQIKFLASGLQVQRSNRSAKLPQSIEVKPTFLYFTLLPQKLTFS